MKYDIDLRGFENRDLFVESAGFLGGPRIIIDGKPAPKGSKRGQYILTDNNKFKVVVQIRQVFLDPVPQLIVDGQVVKLAESLNALQWIWSGLPIILVFLGGALGGVLGATAFWLNTRIFRSEMSSVEKFILTGIVSAIAVIVFFVLASLLGLALADVLGS